MATPKIETWRVFCAIELLSAIRDKISAHIARLRDASPDATASWSRAENVHLTLKFFGEVSTERVNLLSQAAQNATAGVSSFPLGIGSTGSFPNHGAPRVLWIGVDDHTGRLAELQTRLEDECARIGFEKEARAFSPHLTIARLRKPQGARTLALAHKEMGFEAVAIEVSELLVIRSELSSKGSKYTVIARHPLVKKPSPTWE